MARPLLSQQFSTSTLMDGEAIVKNEFPLNVPADDAALEEELRQMQDHVCSWGWENSYAIYHVEYKKRGMISIQHDRSYDREK